MAFKSTCKTLSKVAPDEPIFVLRAQDSSAPEIVLEWCKRNMNNISDVKFNEAVACADAMRKWPKRKSPD